MPKPIPCVDTYLSLWFRAERIHKRKEELEASLRKIEAELREAEEKLDTARLGVVHHERARHHYLCMSLLGGRLECNCGQ